MSDVNVVICDWILVDRTTKCRYLHRSTNFVKNRTPYDNIFVTFTSCFLSCLNFDSKTACTVFYDKCQGLVS